MFSWNYGYGIQDVIKKFLPFVVCCNGFENYLGRSCLIPPTPTPTPTPFCVHLWRQETFLRSSSVIIRDIHFTTHTRIHMQYHGAKQHDWVGHGSMTKAGECFWSRLILFRKPRKMYYLKCKLSLNTCFQHRCSQVLFNFFKTLYLVNVDKLSF